MRESLASALLRPTSTLGGPAAAGMMPDLRPCRIWLNLDVVANEKHMETVHCVAVRAARGLLFSLCEHRLTACRA